MAGRVGSTALPAGAASELFTVQINRRLGVPESGWSWNANLCLGHLSSVRKAHDPGGDSRGRQLAGAGAPVSLWHGLVVRGRRGKPSGPPTLLEGPVGDRA